jgi:hypothetical protein
VPASDQASHPDSATYRHWLIEEFVDRGIVTDRKDLEVRTNFDHESVREVDIAELVASDFAAYTFAERNRAWLKIPPNTPFEVRPRLDLTSSRLESREGVLKPVHFLKVSHHGSHNGTPADDVFEAILPAAPPDNRSRRRSSRPGRTLHLPRHTALSDEHQARGAGDPAIDPEPPG